MTSSFPASQASCRVSFPPCCSYAEIARILLTLISSICAWKGKTYRHMTTTENIVTTTNNRGDKQDLVSLMPVREHPEQSDENTEFLLRFSQTCEL